MRRCASRVASTSIPNSSSFPISASCPTGPNTFAGAVNGISSAHEARSTPRASASLVGDGRLPHPGREQILENVVQPAARRVAANSGLISCHQSGLRNRGSGVDHRRTVARPVLKHAKTNSDHWTLRGISRRSCLCHGPYAPQEYPEIVWYMAHQSQNFR